MDGKNESKPELIGSGAYSLVYRIKSPKGTSDLALKVNLTSKNFDGSGAYKELQTNMELDHEFIVRIRDIAIGDIIHQKSLSYNALDFNSTLKPDDVHFYYPLARGDLASLLANSSKRIVFTTAHNICLHISIAIEYMHAKDYIHRDIKPDNILIYEDENGWKCKICDFGMTKHYLQYDVHSPHVATPYYRAPELTMGYQKYDKRSDVWSMGCVFYEIMTGEKMILIYEDKTVDILRAMKEKLPYMIPFDYVREINPNCISFLSGLSKSNAMNFIKLSPQIEATITQSKFAEFRNMLYQMIQFNHHNRCTMKDVVDSMFFRDKRDIIEKKRRDHPCVPNPYPLMCNISMSDERNFLVSFARKIYSNRNIYRWYTHRVFFLSIYNFDRVLSYTNRNVFSPEEIQIYFMTTMYLSIKIRSNVTNEKYSLYDLLPYNMRSEKNLIKAKRFEDILAKNILRYKIYFPTIYDVALTVRPVSIEETSSMLQLVLKGDHGNINSKTAFEKWQRMKITYDTAARGF